MLWVEWRGKGKWVEEKREAGEQDWDRVERPSPNTQLVKCFIIEFLNLLDLLFAVYINFLSLVKLVSHNYTVM